MSQPPLAQLSAEDQEFVVRFVLASGSLKEVARGYGVSYPTLRARLDQVIERLAAFADGRRPDPMAELLATLTDRGQLGAKDAHRILKQHRDVLRNGDQTDG
ncbi:MAG: DUF2089 family protein [Planctomycetota bacterium]